LRYQVLVNPTLAALTLHEQVVAVLFTHVHQVFATGETGKLVRTALWRLQQQRAVQLGAQKARSAGVSTLLSAVTSAGASA
jgi:hypothetical protein